MKRVLKYVLFALVLFFINIFVINASGITEIDFGPIGMSCSEIMGPNISKLLKLFISSIRIIGAIIAIVNGIISIVPCLHNPDMLKKVEKKLINMAIVLAIIGIFPSLISFIGKILEYDLSCIF